MPGRRVAEAVSGDDRGRAELGAGEAGAETLKTQLIFKERQADANAR